MPGQNEETKHCYFHHREHSDLLDRWRSAPVQMLFIHSKASVMTDPHESLCWSFVLWEDGTRGFYALPQPVKLNIINAHGSVQRTPPHLWLVSGPASLQMTVSLCQKQPVSKELRAMQCRLLIQRINGVWQLPPRLLNKLCEIKPQRGSMQADMS